MGIKNRQRRAAKAKRRAREQARRSAPSRGREWEVHAGEPLVTTVEEVRRLFARFLIALRDRRPVEAFDLLAALATHDARLVDQEGEKQLLSFVAMLWANGWQPGEVIREARRTDARAGRLVAVCVAADHASRAPGTLHARWAAHVEALELPAVDGSTGWLAGFARSERLDRHTLVEALLTAIQALSSVGPLPTIIPPPGAADQSTTSAPDGTADDPVLVKVRALLAQAESTTFDAEAEAFTAKAQELMARHAIDSALLWAKSAREERPTSIRVPIDDPYADIKSLLLQRVAHHGRCKAVSHSRYGLETVVGFASDIASTEMLYTSLLVQSQTALQVEAAKSRPGSRTRSRSFRAAFLLSFTRRIDERLAGINAAVESGAQADHSGALLPVLAARDDAVDDEVKAMFGDLQSTLVRGASDAAGWVRGRMAADQAQLNFGDLDSAEVA